jgi:hypothetical protein
LAVPDDLGQTEVGNLDKTNATGTYALDELALVRLVFVIWSSRLGVPGGDKGSGVEEKILRLDVPA